MPWRKIKTIKNSGLLLRGLLLLDFLFILGHLYTLLFLDGAYDALLLDAKGFGYPEGFQYLKYLGIMGIITYLIVRKKRYAYLPLMVLFAFLLVDDILQLHRWGSMFFRHVFKLPSIVGLSASSLGLLIYTAIMALFFLGLCLWHYKSASEGTRKSFLDIFMLLGIFLFFGVGVDLVQGFFEGRHRIGFVLTLMEEGGEMLALSLLVWYFYRIALTPHGPQGRLWSNLFRRWKSENRHKNTAASFFFNGVG